MLYSSLTPSQQAQAAHQFFFGDERFGFDPHDYDYEVDGAGLVTGRRPFQRETARRKQRRNQPVLTYKLTSREPLSADQRWQLDTAITDLARAVALRLVAQTQTDAEGCAAATSSGAGAVPAALRPAN